MSGFQEELGKATVRVTADTSKLKKDLGKAENAVKSLGSKVRVASSGMTGSFEKARIGLSRIRNQVLLVSFAFAGALSKIKSVSNEYDALMKASRRTGWDYQQFQKLAHVASLAGSDVNALETSLKTFTRTMTYAKMGLVEGDRAFQFLASASGKTFDIFENRNKTYINTIESLRGITDSTKRAEAALLLFGNRGSEVALNLANMSAEDFKKAMNEIEGASDEAGMALEEFNDDVNTAFRKMAIVVAEQMGPMMKQLKEAPKVFHAAAAAATTLAVAMGVLGGKIGLVVTGLTALGVVAYNVSQSDAFKKKGEEVKKLTDEAEKLSKKYKVFLNDIGLDALKVKARKLGVDETKYIDEQLKKQRKKMSSFDKWYYDFWNKSSEETKKAVDKTKELGDQLDSIPKEKEITVTVKTVKKDGESGKKEEVKPPPSGGGKPIRSYDPRNGDIYQDKEEEDKAPKATEEDLISFGEFMRQSTRENFKDGLREAIDSGDLKAGLQSFFDNLFSAITDRFTEQLAIGIFDAVNGAGGGKGSGGLWNMVAQAGMFLMGGKAPAGDGAPAPGGGKAIGGNIMPNRAYIVGERGPELFTPNSRGNIAANGSLGGSIIVNNHNDFSNTNAVNRQELLAALQLSEQRTVQNVARQARNGGNYSKMIRGA